MRSRPCQLTLCFCRFYLSDPGWDRGAWDQNLSATWCRLWWGRGVQGADQSPEGERGTHSCQLLLCQTLPSSGLVTDTILFLFIFASLPCLPDAFIFHTSFLWLCFALGIHWPLSSFSRRAFPLLWLAPTSWLRWKERRSVVVCTPGEWLKWRTQSTMTSSNYAPCLCESPWR